jgi:hypothetical protein
MNLSHGTFTPPFESRQTVGGIPQTGMATTDFVHAWFQRAEDEL